MCLCRLPWLLTNLPFPCCSSGKDDVCLGSRLPCDVDVVGREIQAILSQDEAESRANYSVFGVSPPRRSNNPVVRDSTFGRCVPISQAKAGGCIYSNKLSPSSALSTA